MASTSSKGTLFLVEFVVKKVEFLENALKDRPEYKLGKLVVFIKFLQFSLEIEEEVKAGKLVGSGAFKRGRSCLFSVPNTPPPNLLNAEFYVIRKRPDGVLPDRIALGRTKISFSSHFINVMKVSILRPQELPVCKAIQETLELTDLKDSNKLVGTLTLMLRATCLGKLAVTQLKKHGENSVIVKGNKDDSLYECESVIRESLGGGGLQDQSNIPCGKAERSLAEEFKDIIGGRRSICEDCALLMKPVTCADSALDKMAFKSFYDESNRICVVYQRDGSCCVTDVNGPPRDDKIQASFDARGNDAQRNVNPQTSTPHGYQPLPILREGIVNQDVNREKLSRVTLAGMAGNQQGQSTSQGRKKRLCKDCSRNEDADFDYCPIYPDEAQVYKEPSPNEKLGIKICEDECEVPQVGAQPVPGKIEEKQKPVQRIPRTSAYGRALVLSRAIASQKQTTLKTEKPKRNPVKFLAPARRWEGGGPINPQDQEPPEWTSRFPATQPYNASTDIHIRTPTELGSNVFRMKMLGKTAKNPILQLELRTPRKIMPGDPILKTLVPPVPPTEEKKGKEKGGKGKKGKKK